VVLFFVAGGLDRMQAEARTRNRVDIVTSLFQSVVQPLGVGANNVSNFFGNVQAGIFSGKRLVDENVALKSQIQQAELYTETVTRLESEISSLRKLLALPTSPGQQAISSEIIGFFPNQNRLTLARGKKDGVKPGMPVITAEGVLAIVQTVEEVRCQALMLTSASLKVGAMDSSRNPPQVGLLQGVDSNTLNLTLFDPKSPVVVGDTVVTSGFGPQIPRGLIVGKIIQVQDNLELGTRRAIIVPSASVGRTKEVKILL
jgi:rod shape-determining protein MreC